MIKNIYNAHTQLTLNKSIEVQVYFDFCSLVAVILDIRNKQDHPGVFTSISLLGMTLAVNLYDHRHWDYETGTYDQI